jgi:DNA-binding transcriptional LysR family regulator
MRDLDLTTLRLFVAVCEQRNIARAAEQAHMVGSAISKRLAKLEEAVGTPLLVRRRRGVEPTPAGESLLEHARTMLASALQIERDMTAFAQGVRGQVRVLASASALAEFLADDVAAFLQDPAHRDIRVQMEERVSPEIVRGVREGVASLGVCWDAADTQGLVAIPYRSDHLAVVVHPSHPLAAQSSLRFAETMDYEQVGTPAFGAVQALMLRAAALAGRSVSYRVVVSNFDSALRVVRANLAISVVPREVAQPMAPIYGLRVIPLQEPWALRRFVICTRDLATLAPPVKALLDYLQAVAASP